MAAVIGDGFPIDFYFVQTCAQTEKMYCVTFYCVVQQVTMVIVLLVTFMVVYRRRTVEADFQLKTLL